MKTIEIKTTQNVILQYELADLKDRILAFVIDFIVAMIVIQLLQTIFSQLFYVPVLSTVLQVVLWGSFVFYSLAFEVFNKGQSLGKMAMGIRVIKTIGGQATFFDYAVRWIFRMVDIWFSLGAVASILVASSSKGQRIGDIVANTTVIKVRTNIDLSLKDLMAIRSQNSHILQYPAAKHLLEEDVLLIKSALDRHKQFNNKAHDDALAFLSREIRKILDIKEPHPDNRKFLQSIVHDYVVLTR